MNNKLILIAVLSIAACAGSGCATGDAPVADTAKDTRPASERIKVGMTKDEVRSAIGKPNQEMNNSDGTATWIFSDNAKMFIPFYALSGGKFESITIIFDSDGKVKNFSTGKNSIF